MQGGWQRRRILITVRTYPTPARKGIEVSCTAGITDNGHWIRLFPIPYRYMAEEARFHKYQWIETDVRKATGDPRPESYTPNLDSIRLAGTVSSANDWAARRALLAGLIGETMCGLQRSLRGKRGRGATLGLVKPRSIDRLVIRPDDPEWSAADLERLLQQPLIGEAPKEPLVKMPVKFTYDFRCEGEGCAGHRLRCTDWEMCWTYLSWTRQYGHEEGVRRFQERFFDEMVERNDTHFYVGTHSLYPTWMVVGLFYPPKTAQALLI